MAVDLGQPIEDFTVGAMQGYRGGDPDGDVGRVLSRIRRIEEWPLDPWEEAHLREAAAFLTDLSRGLDG